MKRRSGFTLIEMLVVVSIIAILAGVGLATFTGAGKKSRDTRRMADLESVRSALELYRADNSDIGYPPAGLPGYNGLCCAATSPLFNYLSALPLDPINDATYRYTYAGGGNTYQLCAAKLEQTGLQYCLTPP